MPDRKTLPDLKTTFFAPAGRAAEAVLQSQAAALRADPGISRLLDCFPEAAMVVNRQRQILLVNDKMRAMLGRSADALLGQRPGEAFGCVRVCEGPDGCGTSIFCRYCGAAQALVAAAETREPRVEECRITCAGREGEYALELRIWATPMELAGQNVTVVAVRDTTDEKRRAVLERIFFHDVLDAMSSLHGMVSTWSELPTDKLEPLVNAARDVMDRLVEQIRSHRDLLVAERGDLPVHPVEIDVRTLLERQRLLHVSALLYGMPFLEVDGEQAPRTVRTDEVLLGRVLGNLLRNAIEASSGGETVTLRALVEKGRPLFEIHNDAVMPEGVQAQVFQRSFTTKRDTGHGLGTYSAKLLTERYLGGTIEFRSAPGQGTTFRVLLPAASLAD
ncbi:MAG: PAS domain-containing sensor histidine kinase [Acidobacteria bacterium]|nr:PAS domain-containing sensor histidine kinase [Acidobacteriota bacterium]